MSNSLPANKRPESRRRSARRLHRRPRALKEKPSLETRKRIMALLEAIDCADSSPEWLRTRSRPASVGEHWHAEGESNPLSVARGALDADRPRKRKRRFNAWPGVRRTLTTLGNDHDLRLFRRRPWPCNARLLCKKTGCNAMESGRLQGKGPTDHLPRLTRRRNGHAPPTTAMPTPNSVHSRTAKSSSRR